MRKGLIILHLDGVSAKHFQEAIEKGYMPFTKKLIEQENYDVQSYRCGLPSTTPHSQAGILYGDDTNIPSFRWYDKKSGVEVKFGVGSSFKYVAHKYFKHRVPITKDGACIAACYPGEAKQTFGLAYKDRKYEDEKPSTKERIPLILRWLVNPLHVIDWLWHSVLVIIKMLLEFLRAKLSGESIAIKYLLSDLLEEIFVHHLTRFATGLAMKDGYKTIYSCIYAYDETAHAFSPDDSFCLRTLGEIDRSIQYIAKRRDRYNLKYEMLILSDHGQVPTIPFVQVSKKKLGQIISGILPTYIIDDGYGTFQKDKDAIDGHIELTNSGGISNLYFINNSERLSYSFIKKEFPHLIATLAENSHIGFIMMREKDVNIVVHNRKTYEFKSNLDQATRQFLSQFDNPDIISEQLDKLNSFSTSGDIILFGAWQGNKQINFEVQSGGHGSVGGQQLFPFLLTKKEWNVTTENVTDATGIYPIIRKLQRDFEII